MPLATRTLPTENITPIFHSKFSNNSCNSSGQKGGERDEKRVSLFWLFRMSLVGTQLILALLHFRSPPPAPYCYWWLSWKNAAESFSVALTLTLGGYESAIAPWFSAVIWTLVTSLYLFYIPLFAQKFTDNG